MTVPGVRDSRTPGIKESSLTIYICTVFLHKKPVTTIYQFGAETFEFRSTNLQNGDYYCVNIPLISTTPEIKSDTNALYFIYMISSWYYKCMEIHLLGSSRVIEQKTIDIKTTTTIRRYHNRTRFIVFYALQIF